MGATDTKEIEGLKRRIQELEEKLKGQGNREFKSRLFGFRAQGLDAGPL